jgi:predicted nucleic acid-binding protein
MAVAKPDTLVDTCCILNLCAVEEPQAVLSKLPFRLHVSPAVEQEEISLRPSPDAKRHERRKIDLTPCFTSGVLHRCKLETADERRLYVQLAMELDDGEAMSLAIATIRHWAIATDDAAARKLAARLGLATYGTPQLVRLWAERSKADHQQISAAILRIETLARYIPNPKMPDANWWIKRRPG